MKKQLLRFMFFCCVVMQPIQSTEKHLKHSKSVSIKKPDEKSKKGFGCLFENETPNQFVVHRTTIGKQLAASAAAEVGS